MGALPKVWDKAGDATLTPRAIARIKLLVPTRRVVFIRECYEEGWRQVNSQLLAILVNMLKLNIRFSAFLLGPAAVFSADQRAPLPRRQESPIMGSARRIS
ncbi:hypothetical protein SQ11_06345 [Nitrosospira sp. NpAV]|nr:hypothetical protein SQ11_06345 [Nitrosospira sp. NpAV]